MIVYIILLCSKQSDYTMGNCIESIKSIKSISSLEEGLNLLDSNFHDFNQMMKNNPLLKLKALKFQRILIISNFIKTINKLTKVIQYFIVSIKIKDKLKGLLDKLVSRFSNLFDSLLEQKKQCVAHSVLKHLDSIHAYEYVLLIVSIANRCDYGNLFKYCSMIKSDSNGNKYIDFNTISHNINTYYS